MLTDMQLIMLRNMNLREILQYLEDKKEDFTPLELFFYNYLENHYNEYQCSSKATKGF